jgi:drug/metabolite transporter (DMT)-like permease
MVYATLVVLGWSFPGVFVRCMPQLNPWTIATLRLSVGFLVLLPIVLIGGGGREFLAALGRPAHWLLASFMFVYYMMATAAFQNAPVGEVALLIASAPALALPMRWIVDGRPNRFDIAGTAIALVGVALVLRPGGEHEHFDHPFLGSLFALIAATCAALFAVGTRLITDRGQAPMNLSIPTMTLAIGPLAFPFTLLLGKASGLSDPRTLWCLPMGALSTALPTVCYSLSAGRLPSSVATMINPVVAISANVVAALAISEVPRLWVIPGAILVLAGVTMTTHANRPVKV